MTSLTPSIFKSVGISIFLLNIKIYCEKRWKPYSSVAIDFSLKKINQWPLNYLVTNIVQNVVFGVRLEKKAHTDLEQLDGE